MSAAALTNEFAKMRHLRVGVVAAVVVAAVAGLSLMTAFTSPDFREPAGRSWLLLLAGMSLAVPLVCPVLLAVLASRQTDIEHQSNGWLSSASCGLPPGRLCRTKVLALGLVASGSTIAAVLLVVAAGSTIGMRDALPVGLVVGFTACVLVVNLVLLALHVVLSAFVDNQLVGLGVGVLGTLVAVFSAGWPAWAAGLTPWGHYSLARAADYAGGDLVALSPSYAALASLGLLAAVAFALTTRRLDRSEA